MRSFPISPALSRVTLAIVLLSTATRAETPPAERAAAEAIFQEARKLSRDNKHAEACVKYEESNRIDPSVGTQLYLADCYEKTARVASAWAIFKEVASIARSTGQAEREKSATARANALEARLPKVQLQVAGADTPGLEIRQDGRVLGRGLWSSPLPVDSGKHTIEASAKGRKAWSGSFEASEGKVTTVAIPALLPQEAPAASATASATAPPPPATTTAPAASVAPAVTGEPASGWGTQKTVALVAGGVGVVGVVLGSIFALSARSQWQDAQPLCPADRCNQKGYDLATAARRDGNVATALLAVGGVGLGAGAVLWFTAPRGESAAALGVGPGSLMVRGAW